MSRTRRGGIPSQCSAIGIGAGTQCLRASGVVRGCLGQGGEGREGPHPGLDGGGTRGSASFLAALWPSVPGSASIHCEIEMRLHLFPPAGELDLLGSLPGIGPWR